MKRILNLFARDKEEEMAKKKVELVYKKHNDAVEPQDAGGFVLLPFPADVSLKSKTRMSVPLYVSCDQTLLAVPAKSVLQWGLTAVVDPIVVMPDHIIFIDLINNTDREISLEARSSVVYAFIISNQDIVVKSEE